MSALLEVQGLIKRFGGLTATDNLNLDVREGEIHALIGPNGAGKTTAIAQLCGEIPPNAGTIRFAGEDITALTMPQRVAKGLARSFQITSVLPEFSALDNVALAVQIAAGSSFRFWKNARADRSLTDPARALLAELGVDNATIAEGSLDGVGQTRDSFDVIVLEGAVAAEPSGLFPLLKEGGRLVALLRRNGAGVAHVYVKSHGEVATRAEFNTAMPPLAPAPREESFVF